MAFRYIWCSALAVVAGACSGDGSCPTAPAEQLALVQRAAQVTQEQLPAGCQSFYKQCGYTFDGVPTKEELESIFQTCCKGGGHEAATCSTIAHEVFEDPAGTMESPTAAACNELVDLYKVHSDILHARANGGSHLQQTQRSTKKSRATSNLEEGDATLDVTLEKKHSHHPHGHNPHGHNPHAHNPHSHNPHRHNPHRHTPSPTATPTTASPTESPTETPTHSEFGYWTVTRRHKQWTNSEITEQICGRHTDTLSIACKSSKYCESKHGVGGWVIVNEDGLERSFAFYCCNQGQVEIVGTPTFESQGPDGACQYMHHIKDDGE